MKKRRVLMELIKKEKAGTQNSTEENEVTLWLENELPKVHTLGELARLLQGHEVKLISIRVPPSKSSAAGAKTIEIAIAEEQADKDK
jgi:hypothetical protein